MKARAKCKRSGGKCQYACGRCAGLMEKCKWPEVGGTRVGKGKGKELEKPVIASPHGGEKHKWMKKVAAKDNNNNNKIEEVAGRVLTVSRKSGLDLYIEKCIINFVSI